MLEPDVVTGGGEPLPSEALRCRNVQYLEGSWSARHAGNAFVELVAVSPGDANGRPFRGAGNGQGRSFAPRDGDTAALASDTMCRHDGEGDAAREAEGGASAAARVLLPLARAALAAQDEPKP